MASRDHVLGQLKTLRARLVAQRFCSLWSQTALAAGGVLILAAGVARWVGWDEAFRVEVLGAAFVFVSAIAATMTLARWWSLHDIASIIDRRAGTRDRFVTALAFADEPPRTGESAAIRTLARDECRRFLADRSFAQFFPWRVPREGLWLCVPLLVLAFLWWNAELARRHRNALRVEAQAEVGPPADALERLAKVASRTPDDTDGLARIAEQLRKSATELHATTATREEARKAALRELSELEKMIKDAQHAGENVSPTEWKELAKALAENDATKEVAAALEAGNLAEAARKLTQAAQKDEPTAEEAKKTLAAALQRLAEKRELNQALDELAKEMRSSNTAARALLQRLAQMMSKAQGKQGQAGAPASPEALKNLLSALQSLKFGENGEATDANKPTRGEALDGPVAVQVFGREPAMGTPGAGDASLPTGLPGSERDQGTTASAVGDPEKPQGEKGATVSLAGRLGEGETLSALVPSAGDTSKTTVRYRAIYDAMAPAAENAVLQENIPLGARFFIKRYFEAIRPAD
jgi:uncharacterized coiled-coil DUF342 family protein